MAMMKEEEGSERKSRRRKREKGRNQRGFVLITRTPSWPHSPKLINVRVSASMRPRLIASPPSTPPPPSPNGALSVYSFIKPNHPTCWKPRGRRSHTRSTRSHSDSLPAVGACGFFFSPSLLAVGSGACRQMHSLPKGRGGSGRKMKWRRWNIFLGVTAS